MVIPDLEDMVAAIEDEEVFRIDRMSISQYYHYKLKELGINDESARSRIVNRRIGEIFS